MFSKTVSAAAAVAFATTLVSAQTFTSCDPTKTSCPADPALGSTIKTIDWRKGADPFFNVAEGTTLKYDPTLGAVFTINTENDAPTITSTKYIFFGKVDIVVQASLGVGVVTSVTMQSDDLDEIDWEWLGGDAANVQTNYFSKGCVDVYDRGGYTPVSDPQHNFDTYTIDWTPDYVKWIINGNTVRTLTAASASGCDAFPQTPMQIKIGTWVAGKQDNPNGTVEWAGGYTNFADAPFIGYYQSISIQDYMGSNGATSASSYSYGDHSGTWQSIEIDGSSDSSSSSVVSSAASTSKTSSATGSVSTGTASSTTTTLATVSSSAASTTVTSKPSGSGSGTGSNSTVSTASSAPSTTTSTTPKSAAGKVASNVLLMGAAVFLGALLL